MSGRKVVYGQKKNTQNLKYMYAVKHFDVIVGDYVTRLATLNVLISNGVAINKIL